MFPKAGTDPLDCKNLKFLGFLPGRINYKSTPKVRYTSAFAKEYGAALDQLKQIAQDRFWIVQPTTRNISKTVQSWEERPPCTFENEENKPFLKFAIQFLQREYGQLFKNSIANSEELYSYIDYSKSPGFPANHYGIQTKRELMEDAGYRKFCEKYNNYYIPVLPIWTASPKKEFKHIDEILADKIRMFQIPPFELLRSQLKFGKRVSLRMKEYKWSAYGFNPYEGGCNRLAKTLLTKMWRFIYDISGWDKYLPLLPHVYAVVRKSSLYDSFSPADKEEFDWMVSNTINHTIKLPNGQTYIKNYGNPSGSGCTTRDNILAHVIIMCYALTKAYYKKHNCFPQFQQVADQVVYLFGDDSICSVDDDFSEVCSEDFLSSIYSEFGMKIKYFKGGYDCPLENLSFLGFEFHKEGNFYYPRYDVERLASSMIYEDSDSLDRPSHLSKAYILTVMSYPTEHFKTFSQAYINLLSSIKNPVNETEIAFCRMGPVTPAICKHIYQGLEGSSFSNFFYSIGGGTKEDSHVSNSLREKCKDINKSQSCGNTTPQNPGCATQQITTGIVRPTGRQYHNSNTNQ